LFGVALSVSKLFEMVFGATLSVSKGIDTCCKGGQGVFHPTETLFTPPLRFRQFPH
jgi:hypothetical protein